MEGSVVPECSFSRQRSHIKQNNKGEFMEKNCSVRFVCNGASKKCEYSTVDEMGICLKRRGWECTEERAMRSAYEEITIYDNK